MIGLLETKFFLEQNVEKKDTSYHSVLMMDAYDLG